MTHRSHSGGGSRFWKSQPGGSGELCLEDVRESLLAAASVGEAIRIVTEARPDWSTSRCSRLASVTWRAVAEQAARAVEYALSSEPAERDQGEFNRGRPDQQRDRTGNRAAFNLDERAAMPQLPKKMPSAAMAVAPRAGVPPTRKKEEP